MQVWSAITRVSLPSLYLFLHYCPVLRHFPPPTSSLNLFTLETVLQSKSIIPQFSLISSINGPSLSFYSHLLFFSSLCIDFYADQCLQTCAKLDGFAEAKQYCRGLLISVGSYNTFGKCVGIDVKAKTGMLKTCIWSFCRAFLEPGTAFIDIFSQTQPTVP